MNSEEQFSVIISEALDVLGYNRDLVEARRKFYDEYGKIFTEIIRTDHRQNGYFTISGSKREGLSGINQSDFDAMYTFTDVQCSDDPASVTRDVGYIFEIDREGCPHGYTKLRLFYKNANKMVERIENSMIEYPDGSWYLSSTFLMSELMSASQHHSSPVESLFNFCNEPRSGPSAPITGQFPIFGQKFARDNVFAFPCQCSDYLQSWIHRPRDCGDWPSRDQIETAATVDAHVVPVGAKGSEDAHLQWRICFTLTEVNLMQSLNETKWKLYVTLRMIRDLIFKPLGDLLTSYVLKNVIMWISEFDPIEAFQPKCILQKLHQCLDFLILGFLSKRIPNYMISKRNLLEGRLDDLNTREHLAALNHVRRNLPATILRCTQLKNAMVHVYVAPGTARTEMRLSNWLKMSPLYILPILPLFLNELRSCSTPQDGYDCIMRILVNNPEIIAAAHNIPVPTVVHASQLMKMLPPEIVQSMLQRIASQIPF